MANGGVAYLDRLINESSGGLPIPLPIGTFNPDAISPESGSEGQVLVILSNGKVGFDDITVTVDGFSGILSVISGGTGLGAFVAGDIIFADGLNHLARKAIGSAGSLLHISSGLPTWTRDVSIDTIAVTGAITSTLAIGTAPLVITSTTKVANLNVDLLDDQSGAYYLDSDNFTGTEWVDLTDTGATTLHKHDHGGMDGLADDDHAQYHTDARALTWLGTRSTSDLPEGTNLYYTDERVDDRVDVLIQDVAGKLTWTYDDVGGTLTPSIVYDSQYFSGTNWTDLTDGNETALHIHDHGGMNGLSDDDHTQYVHITTARTITAVHTFNPTVAGEAFTLGANATGQLITGLNADLLDSQSGAYYLAFANQTYTGLTAGQLLQATAATTAAFDTTLTGNYTWSGTQAFTAGIDVFGGSTARGLFFEAAEPVNAVIRRVIADTGGANLVGEKARGTEGTESYALENDTVLLLMARPWDGTGYVNFSSAAIQMYAAENHGVGAAGGAIALQTAALGSTSLATRITIKSALVAVTPPLTVAGLLTANAGITATGLLSVDQNASTTALSVTGGGGGVDIANFARDVGGTGTVRIHASSSYPQITFDAAANTFTMGINNNDFEIADSSAVGANTRFFIDQDGSVGVGTTSPGAKLGVLSTTEQLRLLYSTTEYQKVTVGATGTTAFAKVTAGTPLYTFDAKISTTGEIEVDGDFNHDGTNFGALGATPAPQRAHQADATDLATAITAVNYALATLETFGYHALA